MSPSKRKVQRARPQLRLRPFKIPPGVEAATSNGLSVVAAPRGKLPLVSVRLSIRGGGAGDPQGKDGLTDFTIRLLRRGAGGMAADAVDEAIELLGGQLSLGAGEDHVALAITAPAEHLDAMMDVLGKLVSAPAFAPEEVSSAQERTVAQLLSDLDDPGTVADRALARALWGRHPYGHDVAGSPATVSTFTRDDCVALHRDRLGPRVSLLTIVGAVDPEQAIASAERAFGAWRNGPMAPPVTPPLSQAAMGGQVLIVDKPEQTQSQVRIGTLAIPKSHPDYVPCVVANCVLGAGFTSRLVDEIRVNRGLSYGVSSYFGPLRAGGTFAIDTFTKNETTREIIDVALATTAKVRAKGIGQDELEKAQIYLAGLYPMRLETNEAFANALADVRLNELGEEWLRTYRERVVEVSRDEALRVSREYFFPGPPAIVVVGNAAQVRPLLEGLGPITVQKAAEVG